jgi:hypothetical protein
VKPAADLSTDEPSETFTEDSNAEMPTGTEADPVAVTLPADQGLMTLIRAIADQTAALPTFESSALAALTQAAGSLAPLPLTLEHGFADLSHELAAMAGRTMGEPAIVVTVGDIHVQGIAGDPTEVGEVVGDRLAGAITTQLRQVMTDEYRFYRQAQGTRT